MVPPKFATPRDLSRPTRGTLQGAFAETWLRKPLLPWQQYVADVAGELLPNGRPAYGLVLVTVQRQAGKSHLAMARAGERCTMCNSFRTFYTAQTGQDAQAQFLKFHEEVVKGTPLERMVDVKRGNGRASMTWPNGATIIPAPPTAQTGHGKQSDLYDIDEAWAFDEDQGAAILQAIGPTQLTRPDSQVWVWSAGGTASSTWLANLVARGREGDPDMAYFEWGIPDDLPLDDLQAIAEHHPAYPDLVDANAIRKLRKLLTDDAEFARAAGNRWTEVIGGAISAEAWRDARWAHGLPDEGAIGYGAARSGDGRRVWIACAVDVDGVPVVEIVKAGRETSWVGAHGADQVVAAWADDGPLAVDPDGPSAAMYDALDAASHRNLIKMTRRDVSAACGWIDDAIEARAVKFVPNPDLDAASAVVARRTVGDGGYVWSRTSKGAPAAPMEAATLAVHALRHRKPSVGRPRILLAN